MNEIERIEAWHKANHYGMATAGDVRLLLAEVRRLRAIEDAARALVAAEDVWQGDLAVLGRDLEAAWDALRAALAPEPAGG